MRTLHPENHPSRGPWTVAPAMPTIVLDVDRRCILAANREAGRTPLECEANARLASKAPELLRALERAHGLLDLLLYAKTLPPHAETEAFHVEVHALCEAARGLR